MLFNSISFAIFLPVVFICYWIVINKSLRIQNLLLLLASYFFYASWDYRFLILLSLSTILDFYTGIMMADSKKPSLKKLWFLISLTVNLSFLGFFKYYNFFAVSFSEAISPFGLQVNPHTLSIILPLGISFYTFHGLSYVIDIYKERIKPERNFIDYSVFVCFFPLLVAGPIARATHLLPQIKAKRTFDYTKAIDGLKQIAWGLFKKIVIADQCAEYANIIFDNAESYSGSTHVLGALFFAFQIYGDFSGYSDIAIGTGRLFGIELMRNFAFPYFSRDISEFWKRWHISLTSWFRDYVYIPLGGNKGSVWLKIRNTLIIFLLSGFWHGANWTFILWGLLNALYIIPSVLFNRTKYNQDIVAQGKTYPTLNELFSMCITFSLVSFAWIIFRAENVSEAYNYILKIFSLSLFTIPRFHNATSCIPTLLLTLLFILVEWAGREEPYALAKLGIKWPAAVRWAIYYAIIFAVISFVGTEQKFIYFQF